MPSADHIHQHISIAEKSPNVLTLQKTHRAVQTLRTQFVIAERPQKLTDQDIDGLRYLDPSHVTRYEHHRRTPFFRLASLEADPSHEKRGLETHAGEDARHKGIRVLLDCVDKCIFLGSLNSFEASRNEGTTPSTSDTNDTTRY